MATRAPASSGRRATAGGRPSGKNRTGKRNRDARRGSVPPPGNWRQEDKWTLARDDGRAWIHRGVTVREGAKVWRFRALEAGGDHYDGPAYVAPWRETLVAAKWDAHDLID